jgi:hypothetical protein
MSSWKEHFTASGITRLGVASDEASSYFTDWVNSAGWIFDTSTGVSAGSFDSAPHVGGVVRLNAVGGGHCQLMNGVGSSCFPVAPLNGTGGQVWYLAARMANGSGSVSANTFLTVGLRNAPGGIQVVRAGINGPISSTHFAVQLAGGTDRVSTTAVIPSAFFDLELWCDGTNVGLSINEATAETWSVSGVTSSFGGVAVFAQELTAQATGLFDKTLLITVQPT